MVGPGAVDFADKNAGTGKVVTVGGLALSGADAQNYLLPASLNGSGNILPRALAVAAPAQSRSDDASPSVAVTLSDDRVAGDQIALDYGRAQCADKNAGTGKTVTVIDVRVSGADAGNYAVTRGVTAQADIAPAQLNITATGLDHSRRWRPQCCR